jgi:hypothetical protein
MNLHENIFTRGLKTSLSVLRFEPVDIIFGRVIYEGIDFSFPGPNPNGNTTAKGR